MALTFEEDVAIEEVAGGRGRARKYDWEQLRRGPHPAVFDDKEQYQAAMRSARDWAKKNGAKVSGRHCLDGKFRIWRIS